MPKVLSHDAEETDFRNRSVRGIQLFVSELAINDMIHHSDHDTENEVMGLIIGRMYRDDEGSYATAERIITSNLVSSAVSVRFDTDSMEKLIDGLDALEYKETVVGWYHSHPGLGCFMSETDVRTHTGAFGDGRFSIVIDPARKEIMAFGSNDGTINEVQFVVMED